MNANAYQLLALGARYWFVLLAAILVWRGAVALLQEHHQRKKLLKKLPDAGMVGEMRDTDSDRAYPLPREGVLGGGRACDIRLRGLRRRAVSFTFVDGKGLMLTPCHSRGEILLDGAPLGKGGYALHGAVLHVGGYTLRIRLFAGLNVPRPAPYEERWHTAYEDEELYAPEYAAMYAAQMGYGEAPQGNMPAFTPVPPAFQTFDTMSVPVVSAQPMQTDAAPQTVYQQPVACPQQNVYQQQNVYPRQIGDQMQAGYSAQAAYPQQDPQETASPAPSPFDGGMYTPAGEDIPAPFEAPRRHRRSERRQGK
jgi:hypothetical protein